MLRGALRVAFADFSAAPWQGFEKSERGPNSSSLFQPLAAVVAVALGWLLALPAAGPCCSNPSRSQSQRVTYVYPGDCDGQSGYGVSKLDSIVEEVVRQIFAQFREVSRKKLLESVKTNDAARIQKKIKKIQKDLEAKQKELDDLKAETILVIRGVSALDKELLGTLVAEAKDALETLEKQLVQAQEEYEEATKTAKRSNYICNELFTWADVYDTAYHDDRRAILQQFIKEIRVRKDYEISITLNASFNQVEQLKSVSIYDGAEIFEEISEKGA